MKLVPEESPLLRLLLFSLLPLLVGALIVVRLAPDFVLAVAHCPLREITGFPCPTCGGTLSANHLVMGHWTQAVHANPLVVLVFVLYGIVAGYATIATLVPRWRRWLQLTRQEKRTAKRVAILLVALNWAWLIWRYLF